MEVMEVLDSDIESVSMGSNVRIVRSRKNLSEAASSLEEIRMEVPDHVQNLFDRSVKDLHMEETVGNLLTIFQSVFAKCDLDLGLFRGAIKHKINTEDAKPIRQRMRRTPLRFEKEEEGHLKQS